MDVLHNHNTKQIVTSFTHIHGNTLDLVCTNNPAFIHKIEAVSLGLSDHSLVIVQLAQSIQSGDSGAKKIKLYHRTDGKAFREGMHKAIEKLENMKDPEAVWHLFTDCINNHVPMKEMKQRNSSIVVVVTGVAYQ